MKKSLTAITLLCIFALASCAKGSAGAAKTELKLAHTFNDSHPISQAYNNFAAGIEKATGGAYVIKVFGNGQLGEQRAAMELVQSGSVDLASVYVGNLETVVPNYSVITTPYMFISTEHFYKSLTSDAFREKIYNSSLDKGFIGLMFYDAGTRNFYNSVRPIYKPSDLKGLRVRVSESPTAIRMATLLGASPVAMPYGEVYTAIQQKLIDGAENNPTSLTTVRHGEVAKFYSFTEHTRIPDMLIVSSAFWKKLDDKTKKIFIDVAKQTSEEFTKVWYSEIDRVLATAEKDMGVKVNKVDNIEDFRKLVLPMHNDLAAQSPDLKYLVEYVKSIQ